MNDHEHTQRLVEEFNDRAKAEGHYLDKDFWEIPRRPGSILDIPETEKSREDLAWFRARRLERRKAAAEQTEPVQQLQDEVKETLQEQLQGDSTDAQL